MITGDALEIRLGMIADHTDEAGNTDPYIWNELDARHHVHEAYAHAIELLEAVEWAEKMERDGAGGLAGPKLIRELAVTLMSMLDQGVTWHEDWYTLAKRRAVLAGEVDELLAEGEVPLAEITDAVAHVLPVLHCGEVR